MNAKISPYMAMMSAMREVSPTFDRVPAGNTWYDTDTSTTYLDAQGNVLDTKQLTKGQKKVLEEYVLVQYDQSVGKHYLDKTAFYILTK